MPTITRHRNDKPTPPPSPPPLPTTEAARGGEFNRGGAQQFGGYDLTNQV